MSEEIDLTPDPMLGAGTWSNWIRLLVGKEEVTIDFAIRNPIQPDEGLLVARITLPPGTAFKLRDVLIEELRKYTERGQPPEWTD